MNIPRPQSRSLIRRLVVEEMHYCCPWWFFTTFRQTGVIADRLGLHPATVRAAKQKVDDGEWCCENHPHCLRRRLTKLLLPRKRNF